MIDVAGRAGFAPAGSNFLVYGLVGWTWADMDASFRIRDVDDDVTLFHNDDNFSANGLTFGGGVEWKFTENLSVRGEYRFTDLDNFGNNGRFGENFNCDFCDGDFKSRNDVNLNVQRVLFTLNWHFRLVPPQRRPTDPGFGYRSPSKRTLWVRLLYCSPLVVRLPNSQTRLIQPRPNRFDERSDSFRNL